MSNITLDNHELRLVVDPAQGMNVYAFSAFRQGDWLPIMPNVARGLSDLKESSFLMVPYSNRIEDGRFSFGGQSFQLAGGAHHAIHGDVRTRPWQVDVATDHRVRASFDSRQHQGVNWPWPFTATAEYQLDNLTLTAR